MKAKLFFADEKGESSFNSLKTSSKFADRELRTLLEHAFDALSELRMLSVECKYPKPRFQRVIRTEIKH
jgi:hypothetical protein